MASDFNIGILSTLDIDSSSSRKKINDTIKNIEGTINSIKTELEVGDSRTSESTIKKSANNVINNINQSGDLRKLNVELDVNLTKSKQNIQRALSSISNDFANKKILVDVEAKTNAKSVNKAKNDISNGTQPVSIDNSPRSQRETRDIKEQEKAYLDLSRTYKSVDDLNRALNANVQNGLRRQIKEIKNADGSLKSYQVTLDKVSESGKKLGSQKLNYVPNQNGLNLKEVQSSNQIDKARKEEHEQVSKLLDIETSKYSRLLDQGKIDIKQHNALLQTLKQITAEKSKGNLLNRTDFTKAKKDAEDVANSYQRQNQLLRQQQNLLSQIESKERRQSANIDKQATSKLKSQLSNLGGTDKTFGKEAAFQMNQIQGQIRQISAEAERATRTQLGFVESFKQAMMKFPLWLGTSTLFFGAIQGGKELMSVITDIDSKMITLNKVMGDESALSSAFVKANEAATNYGQTLSDVLDVYAEFARQGFKGDELTQFGNAGLIASNVGEIGAKQASEYLTSMSAQWNTDANDAMRQVDSLNEISNNYATTVEKVAQGQTKAGSTAKSMGMTFDETNGVIGALTAKTKQSGDEIGNFMKATLPKLYNGKGKATLEGLGINLKDGNGDLKSAINLLEEASHKVKDLDKDQQAAVVQGLGGVYHYQRMQVLLDDLDSVDSKYKQIKDTSENSAGSALQENATYMQSIEAKVNKAKTAFEQLALAAGDAFVKSGMLDGIRMATQLLAGLTNGITNLGSTAPILGMVGGALSLFSKNVRSGFESGRQSLANFIAESNNLSQVKNNLGQVTGLEKIGASSQLQFDSSGNYDKQASQAKAASESTHQFKRAQDELSLSAMATSGAITKNTMAVSASTLAMKAAGTAATVFKTALRGLMAATGIGLALTGVSFALEKIIGHFDKASQASEQFKQQQDQTKQAIQGMSNNDLNKMINDYDRLKQKMDSGQTFNDTEAKQYKDTVSQLANIFPDLVTGEGQYGKTIEANGKVLKDRIAVTKQQIELEKQKAAAEKETENQKVIKEQDKIAKKTSGGMLGTASPESKLVQDSQAGGHRVGLGQDISDLNTKIKKIKDVEGAQKALKTTNDLLSNATKAGNDREIQALTRKKNALNNYIQDTGKASLAQKSALQAATQSFTNQVNQMKAGTYKIGSAGQSTMQALANSVQKVSKTGGEAQSKFRQFENTLVNDSGFVNKMKGYENALKKFKSARNASEQKDALPALEKAYSSVGAQILKAAKQEGIHGKALKNLRTELANNIKAETNVTAKVDKEGRVHLNTSNKINKNTKSTDRNTDSKVDNAEASDEAADANSELADSMRSAASDHELLSKAMDELKEGSLSWDTMADLVDKYGDEVLAMGNDQASMMDFLKTKNEEEADSHRQALEEKLMNSESYYKAVAGAGTDLANHLKDTYGIDASNYGSLSELKAGIVDQYNHGSIKEQEKLVDSIADAYNIDLSNYGTLGEKKDALEAELLTQLDAKWTDHMNELKRKTDEVFSALDSKLKAASKVGNKKGYNSAEYLSSMTEYWGAPEQQQSVNVFAKNVKASYKAGSVVSDAIFKKATGTLSGLGNVADQVNTNFGELGQSANDLNSGLGDTGKAGKGAGKGLGNTGKAAKGAVSGLGNAGSAAKSAGKGAKDASDGFKDANKELSKTKKEAQAAGVTVEKLYKTYTMTTYVADKLEASLNKVNNQLEKQKLITQKYATWSAKYRDSLKAENKLIDEKTKKLKQQMESMEKQISSGKVTEYGMVNSEANAPYYQYTANNMNGDQKASISTLSGSSTQGKVWNFLKSKGFSDAQVSGVMGNIEQESRFDPAAEQMKGWNGGKGLAQWDDRKDKLKAFAQKRGKSWKDLQVQLDFMWEEMMTTENKAYRALKSTSSVTQAARVFQTQYERAGIPNQVARDKAATKYYNQFKGTNGTAKVVSDAVKGTIGKSIVSDKSAYFYDSKFGRYNNGGTHYGRDLTSGNINGSAIKAAKSGVVTFKGWTGGGNTLSIYDGKNTYTYMHMKNPAKVVKGAQVKAGQVVGNVGTTYDASKGGYSSGPHLHIQVNQGKTPSGTFIDTFSGKNKAIDAVKAGYTRVSGSSKVNLGSLSKTSAATGEISAGMAEDLNKAEQDRLNKIEAAVNEYNKAEDMKQKVDDLRKTLMDKQLEEVQSSHEKDENLYAIQKSHVEEYDHWREVQQSKTAQLEYELNKVEFQKGRNSNAWREKNKQVQASKELERGYESQKVTYINKSLKKNKNGLFGKGTTNRDEFEQMKREAQQNIRDLKEGIMQASGEIATSMIDQILEEYEDKSTNMQASIDKLGKEKEKLDTTDEKQARKSIAISKEQARQSKELADYTNFYIKNLKNQLALTGKNYELQKSVKDQIKEMKVAYDDATLAAHNFLIEAADMDIERQLNVNNRRLAESQKAYQKAEYKSSFINQDFQIDLWRKNEEEKVKGYIKERTALEKNKSELKDMLEIYKSLPSQAQKLRDALTETNTQIQENNKNVYALKYDLANGVISQIKSIYQKQLEVATKAYDDEYKEYEKMINKKLKLLDDEQNEDQFNKDVKDKTEQLNKIRDEIAQRTGDDSLANQKKLKDLREQLRKQEEEYNTYLTNKNRDDQRKALQEELNDKNEQNTKQKEDLNKAYQDLLDDTRKFNQIQEQLMEGQTDKYKSLIKDLTKYVNSHLDDIGRSTSQNLIDGLSTTFKSLTDLSKVLKDQDKKKTNPVPNSGLKPTAVKEAQAAAVKKVNSLSPSAILKDLNIKPIDVPKDVKSSNTVTNNKTIANALVNIESFKGTQKEADKLANTLATAMRKEGLL
ncbi:phage tail tape measure protein [Staphylococcus pseudoxylosus]|uniref:phage tail tape measure protein n=1 Tax=Staphylococcus pseudoxylosus TaxID=2282419 RepID=UPI00398A85FD